jgi:Flp pilus assembly protein TadD
MTFTLCAIVSFGAVLCSAQQSDLIAPGPQADYRVAEAPTITIEELQQRTVSKALGVFADAKTAARLGQHAHAIKLFEKALRIDPLLPDARNDLAVEFIVRGEPDRAVEQLRQLIQTDPHFMMAYTNLAVILCEQQKYSDAEPVLRRALSVDPKSAKASLLLAIALYGQGKRGADTRSALETAAKSNPRAVKLLKEWFGARNDALEELSRAPRQAALVR